MPTTPDDIYRRLRQAVVDELAPLGVAASRVSVVAEYDPDLNSDFSVQIRQAGGAMGMPRVGVQLVEDVVEIRTTVREMKDQGGKSTLQLTGNLKSAFYRLEPVRRALRNNWLDYTLAVPLRQIRHGQVTREAQATGFAHVLDTWAMTYEISNASAWMKWSSTAPTTLTGTIGVPVDSRTQVSRATTGAEYVWALVPAEIPVVFWHEAGMVRFFSPDDLPPSGPTCASVTIDDVEYWQWRSPFPSFGTSAEYRVAKE